MSITIEQVSRTFGTTQALQPSSLDIQQGELVGLLGPSGSGKTTLLRIVAGLETPTAGKVYLSGHDVTRVHPRDRRVGFVFQHYALFRHMTVFDNIAFGLRAQAHRRKLSKGEIHERVHQLLQQTQLVPFAKRLPAQLSGGQQQRVALARALAIEPEVLLMDEPFGALDAKVRIELRRWLRQLHQELGFTCLFVTHDQDEALELSDRVAVMSQGRIEQVAPPSVLYQEPANRFVFNFLGATNSLKGVLENQRLTLAPQAHLDLPDVCDGAIELLARPHDLSLSPTPTPQARLPVTVTSITTIGALVNIDVTPAWDGPPWQISLPINDYARASLKPGDQRFVVPYRLQRVNSPQGELLPLRLPAASIQHGA